LTMCTRVVGLIAFPKALNGTAFAACHGFEILRQRSRAVAGRLRLDNPHWN
jgi:hypothetical protein